MFPNIFLLSTSRIFEKLLQIARQKWRKSFHFFLVRQPANVEPQIRSIESVSSDLRRSSFRLTCNRSPTGKQQDQKQDGDQGFCRSHSKQITPAFHLRRAISIQAESNRLVEKNAIAPSAARLWTRPGQDPSPERGICDPQLHRSCKDATP